MSQRNLAWLIVVPALVLFAAVMSATAPPPEPQYRQVRTLVDVLAEVEQNFYRELSAEERQKLVEDMINGGLARLDPYSEYFNEAKLRQFSNDTKGTFGGIGAYLGTDPKTGILKIDSPMPDSPAIEAGLQADDLILKVDGKSTEGMATDDARGLIKGEPGTSVVLNIRRRGRENDFDVTVTRAVIQVHPVKGVARKPDDPKRWEYLADPAAQIAVIRLVDFNETAAKELLAALKEIEAAGVKGLVLDMRGNPGGLLRMATEVTDLFLAGGHIVRTRDRHDTGRDVEAKKDGTVWESAAKVPMAVVVNRFSASAAEIVAAALQDNGRAVVVGERSYGKGSVQKTFEAPDGKSALKLTTEKWLTPNGRNITRWPDSKETDDWGVKPDAGFEVKLTDDELVQYFLHLREVELNRPKDRQPEPPPAEQPRGSQEKPPLPKLDPNYKDKVLERALDHLRLKVKETGRAPKVDGLKPT